MKASNITQGGKKERDTEETNGRIDEFAVRFQEYTNVSVPVPTALYEPETEAPFAEEGAGCYIDGKHYSEGARMPRDPKKPCEVCYCIRNSSACVLQDCELHVDGCSPVFSRPSCCPTRYNCSIEAATTVPPGLLSTEAPDTGKPSFEDFI
nr:uncharacterized protein LOC129387979 [Dermacentor andersoni]